MAHAEPAGGSSRTSRSCSSSTCSPSAERSDMAAQPPAVAASRFRWAFWGVLLLLALGVALALLLLARGRDSSSPGAIPAADAPSAMWAAGAVRAPGFRLADQNGTPFSLASLRG